MDWLASERIEVDDDPGAFTKLATDSGWGDDLPLIPPREGLVRDYVAASGRFPDELIAELPPRGGRCTVEKVAINAVMAGCKPEYFPVVLAGVEALCEVTNGLAKLPKRFAETLPPMRGDEHELPIERE